MVRKPVLVPLLLNPVAIVGRGTSAAPEPVVVEKEVVKEVVKEVPAFSPLLRKGEGVPEAHAGYVGYRWNVVKGSPR